MRTLAKQFLALPADQKRKAHFLLCENALQVWREFSSAHGRIRFADSVCGTVRVVDTQLPEEAFSSADRGYDLANVSQRYLDPIVAIEDQDLKFPEPVEYAYYAIYNLFRKYGLSEEIDDWLIVNQALSTETNESKWQPLFEQVLAAAMEPGANET